MTTNHQTLIESILDDEGLTDGLIDEDAKIIIDWCIQEIEKLIDSQFTESELEQKVRSIKQKARRVCKMVQKDESSEPLADKIQQLLNLQGGDYVQT